MDDAGRDRRTAWSTSTLDEPRSAARTPDVEHERAVAIYDLLEENSFAPVGDDGGPYQLHAVASSSTGWCSTSRDEDGEPVVTHILSLTPFRRDREGLFHDLRELLRRRSAPRRRARSRRSTWAGAACTTRARRPCWSG